MGEGEGEESASHISSWKGERAAASVLTAAAAAAMAAARQRRRPDRVCPPPPPPLHPSQFAAPAFTRGVTETGRKGGRGHISIYETPPESACCWMEAAKAATERRKCCKGDNKKRTRLQHTRSQKRGGGGCGGPDLRAVFCIVIRPSPSLPPQISSQQSSQEREKVGEDKFTF